MKAIPGEVWARIPFAPSHEVSDLGRVRRLEHTRSRMHPKTRKVQEFIFRPRLLTGRMQRGYVVLTLEHRQVLLHRIVLTAFVGEPPAGHQGCHVNGKPDDNRLVNLRWDTAKGNSQDRIRHGTQTRGETHGTAKFSDEAVQAVLCGMSKADTLKRWGISGAHFYRIKRGESRKPPE